MCLESLNDCCDVCLKTSAVSRGSLRKACFLGDWVPSVGQQSNPFQGLRINIYDGARDSFLMLSYDKIDQLSCSIIDALNFNTPYSAIGQQWTVFQQTSIASTKYFFSHFSGRMTPLCSDKGFHQAWACFAVIEMTLSV